MTPDLTMAELDAMLDSIATPPRKSKPAALALPASGYSLRLKDSQQFHLDSQLDFVRDCIEYQQDRDPLAKRFECRRNELEDRGVPRLAAQCIWDEVLHGMRAWTPAKESAGGDEAVGPAAFRYTPLPNDSIGRTADGALNINQMMTPLELVDAPLRPSVKSLTFFRTNGTWWVKVVWGRNRRKR